MSVDRIEIDFNGYLERDPPIYFYEITYTDGQKKNDSATLEDIYTDFSHILTPQQTAYIRDRIKFNCASWLRLPNFTPTYFIPCLFLLIPLVSYLFL